MMSEHEQKIYTLEEAAQAVGLAPQVLAGWVELGLVVSGPRSAGSEPKFDEADLELVRGLKGLRDVGYSDAELRKIQRKVGLPRPKQRRRRNGGHYLTVGELAERSSINARTIKYWEERGIIEPTSRSEGGFRLYDEHYVELCHLIQDLQNFGYTLDQIKDIAELFRVFYSIQNKRFSGSDEQKLEAFEQMLEGIKALNGRMDELTQGIERWHKLLKEKRSEILGMRKRMRRSMEKAAQGAPRKAPSSS